MRGIKETISDADALRDGYINRQGFIFSGKGNVYDTLIIRNPEYAEAEAPKFGFSDKSLEEHIKLINDYKLEKAIIIAEDIRFLLQCPTLKHLTVLPSESAGKDFDFSPLYKMPELRTLCCHTENKKNRQCCGSIDYSKVKGIRKLGISGKGHNNYKQLSLLEDLAVSDFKGKEDLTDLFTSPYLKNLTLIQCGIKSLKGIETSKKLSQVELWYNRSLNNISDLQKAADTLTSLSIEACAKITDFSCLEYLTNVEHLELWGSNTLPDLHFLENMKKLKTFTFDMEVLDGNLQPCLNIPYVYCGRARRYYNLKDKDLPKGEYIR